MRRRWVLLGVLGAIVVVQATGGFTTATLDRPLSIAVVDDEDGLLGVESESPIELGLGNNKDVTLLTLTNNEDGELDVSVSVNGDTEGPPPVVKQVDAPASLAASGPGSTGAVTANVKCGANPGNTQTFSVEVSATGDDVSIELTRDVTISCPSNPGNENGGPPE